MNLPFCRHLFLKSWPMSHNLAVAPLNAQPMTKQKMKKYFFNVPLY